MDNIKPIKKKKSLGVPKSKVLLDTTDIYDQDDSNHSRDSFTKKYGKINLFFFFSILLNIFVLDNEENDNIQSSKTKVRKPTKAAVIETERKMQQLSRCKTRIFIFRLLPTIINFI
jgi:hypothetical protein